MAVTVMIPAVLVACLVSLTISKDGRTISNSVSAATDRPLSEDLADKTFGVKTGHRFWAIKFYQPWCSHCIKFKPEWETFSSKLPADSQIHIGEVNCAEQSKLVAAFGIDRIPAVFMYHNRNVWKYEGNKTADALLEFFKEHPTSSWEMQPVMMHVPEDSDLLEQLMPAQRKAKNDAKKVPVVPAEPDEVELARDAIPIRLTVSSLAQLAKDWTGVVNICSPYTQKCQDFIPKWLSVVAELKRIHGNAIQFGELELSDEVSKIYGVQDTPALLLFQKGGMFHFKRDIGSLVTFIAEEWTDAEPLELPILDASSQSQVVQFIDRLGIFR